MVLNGIQDPVLIPLRVNCLFGLAVLVGSGKYVYCLNPSQGQLPLRTEGCRDEIPTPLPSLNPSQGQLPLRTRTHVYRCSPTQTVS